MLAMDVDGTLTEYNGNYSYYRMKKAMEEQEAAEAQEKQPVGQAAKAAAQREPEAECTDEVRQEKMRQAQVRKNLHEKADDLAASTMNLQRKNELLQRISVDIDKTIESEKRGEPSEVRLKRLRALSELVRENIVHDNDWQKFQHNFDLVYDDFLKRLGEKFPSLSLSDKRICAYIRMDLGSKDIAPLLGMTVRSVEMTRYRIRQKIGLTREDNLTAFLQKF